VYLLLRRTLFFFLAGLLSMMRSAYWICLPLLISTAVFAISIPETPIWPSGRCTDKSLSIPSWILSSYKVSSGTTTFRINNRAYQDSPRAYVTCSPGKEECQLSAIGNEVKITLTKGEDGNSVINIKEFWVCSDEGDT